VFQEASADAEEGYGSRKSIQQPNSGSNLVQRNSEYLYNSIIILPDKYTKIRVIAHMKK
jgi:hypothetical protein